eukprot:CAMPEP_0117041644 /NCGR_PEP_ID=MMETSP0472-20121206/29060_1 /TAXON_ID=693140 ORGANISM="Tiarina fusus, Strain LIS" /NCGR_SAMPLE_ID=MMETSP0472 /ASSEMBLY_ACC=CAM_ASM_000603 /LENGTH=86 /DNA_ID=CAMNT_0004752691 /DNA_START=270 /DNA_END=526 /DNA_ORIENTATION=-
MKDPVEAAMKLKDEAFDAGSTDNISVVVVRLGDNHTMKPKPEHDPVVARGLWKPDFSDDDGSSSAVEVESESDEEDEDEDEEEGET